MKRMFWLVLLLPSVVFAHTNENSVQSLHGHVDTPPSTCLVTQLIDANGVFIACDPIELGAGALTFELQGRTITYDGNRIIVSSAWTVFEFQNCAGHVALHDASDVGYNNTYGISTVGDVYISDGTSPLIWIHMSKVLNASGVFVCSNTNLGSSLGFFNAELILDHNLVPTPYTVVPK